MSNQENRCSTVVLKLTPDLPAVETFHAEETADADPCVSHPQCEGLWEHHITAGRYRDCAPILCSKQQKH